MIFKRSGLALCALAMAAGGVYAQSPAAAPRRAPAAAEAAKQNAAQTTAPNKYDQAEGIAAIVNDQVVSTFDVNQRGALILVTAGIEPTPEALARVRQQALRGLVDERLQLQEAKDHKITIATKEVDGALEDIARSNRTTLDVLGRQLASAGIGVATLRTQIEAELAWRRFVSGRYGARVRISNVQVQDTLTRIAANAAKPQYLVSVILLPAETPTEVRDAQAAAQKLMDEIAKGANFAMVARQFSGAPSAAAGGDMGWLAEGEIKPEALQQALLTRAPGQLIGPVTTPGGIYILMFRNKRDSIDVKSAAKVTLKQISSGPAQRADLDRARRKVRGCGSVDAAVAGTNMKVVDLGEVEEAQLSDQMRQQVSGTPVGGASEVFQADGQTRSLVVCARDTAGGALPSKDEVENRLYEEELAMLAQRHLRNLRRESTILTR